jgi:hypothetical protein
MISFSFDFIKIVILIYLNLIKIIDMYIYYPIPKYFYYK